MCGRTHILWLTNPPNVVLLQRAALTIEPSSERKSFIVWIRLEMCPALQSEGSSERKSLC